MMLKLVRLVAVRIVVLVAIALAFTATLKAEEPSGPAPDFSLPDNGGKSIKLSDFGGDVVMINFWASWCAPCRKEMPLLDAMYKQYKNLGFTLLGVNVEEDSAKAKVLLKEVGVSFPVVFDQKNSVSQLYKLVAMPTTVIVDRAGQLRYVHAGYVPGDEQTYDKKIRSLLKE